MKLGMLHSKEQWLKDFRSYAETILAPLQASKKSRNDKASEINKQIKIYRDKKLKIIKRQAISEKWNNERLLNEILCVTYVSCWSIEIRFGHMSIWLLRVALVSCGNRFADLLLNIR